MAITYASQTGTLITSFAMTEVLPDQAQQSGNNTIIVSDLLSVIGGGNIGSGANGVGDSYIGRLLAIDLGLSTQQVKRCITDVAGTGTTRILTVHEDWDTVPIATTDTVNVCYEVADIEDGGSSGGIGLNARTGLWELSNTLTIGNATDPAGLQIVAGQAVETKDDGANINSIVENAGRLFVGYESGGAPINGGIITAYNGVAAEPWTQFKSGSYAYIYDSLFWAQLVTQKLECVAGSLVHFWKTKIISGTNELHLYDAILDEAVVGGKGDITEIVRVNSGTVCNGLILSDVDTLDTIADTATETVTLSGVIFSGVTDYINVRANKTWNIIDPVWGVTSYTDFTWIASTLNAVNDKRSITATVQTADGTKLENALVNVYEHTLLADLVLKLTTDVNGYAKDSFIYKAHITNSVTNTYGGHALQCGKWLYLPFVAVQSSTDKFNGAIVLSPDNNIVQTTQATAITSGSGVTWNEDTNPSSIVAYTGGAGTLSVGDTVTGGTSGATGIVTKIIDGDSVSGTVHLKTRDVISFSGTESLGNGITWTATLTSGSEQRFSIWIDAITKSLQTLYDYIAALTTETTLSSTGEIIWEWCKSNQTQSLYATGTSFYTERSDSKGLIVINAGAGNLDYFTDDAGITWIPPISYSISFNVSPSITGYEWRMYTITAKGSLAGSVEVAGEEVATQDNQSYGYVYAADIPFAIQILSGPYVEKIVYTDLKNSDQNINITLSVDNND